MGLGFLVDQIYLVSLKNPDPHPKILRSSVSFYLPSSIGLHFKTAGPLKSCPSQRNAPSCGNLQHQKIFKINFSLTVHAVKNHAGGMKLLGHVKIVNDFAKDKVIIFKCLNIKICKCIFSYLRYTVATVRYTQTYGWAKLAPLPDRHLPFCHVSKCSCGLHVV